MQDMAIHTKLDPEKRMRLNISVAQKVSQIMPKIIGNARLDGNFNLQSPKIILTNGREANGELK